jgi:hypothetical protein
VTLPERIEKKEHIDTQFLSIDNLIFEYYEFSTISGRRKTLRSWQRLAVKVILEHLNLSVSSCQGPVSVAKEDIAANDLSFLVNTIEDHKLRSKYSDIFYSGEVFFVQFASAFHQISRQSLFALIGPLGWKVLIATFLTGVSIICILRVLSNVLESLRIEPIISTVVRPLLDQCEERKLPSEKIYFRLILLTWLFYCLIVTETYRSELISHMMKRHEKFWMEKFQEIAEDPTQIVVNLGTRPGHIVLNKLLYSEFENSKKGERRNHFQTILRKLNESVSFLSTLNRTFPDKEFRDGTVIAMGDRFIVESFSDTLEKIVGSRYYELSMERIISKVYWSVKYGPRQGLIISLLQWLRDCGFLAHFRDQQDTVDRAVINHQTMDLFKNAGFHLDVESDVARQEETLKMRHVEVVILLLGFGFVASVVAFCTEGLIRAVPQCKYKIW